MAAPAPFVPQTTPAHRGSRRTWLVVVGVSLIVAGLVAGTALWIAAARRLDDAVTGLARAPIGCTTTLNFSETGEFLIFVESAGTLEEVRGDCGVAGTFGPADTSDDPPDPLKMSMIDPDGGEIDLRVESGPDYDAAGFVGRAERVVEITTTGDHLLTVAENVDEDGRSIGAVAVGTNPNDGVTTIRAAAVVAALIGLLAGAVCLVIGSRRTAASSATGPWGGTAWPSAPPPGQPPGSWPGSTPPGSWPTSPPQQEWPTRPPTMHPPASPPTVHPPSGPPTSPPSSAPATEHPPSGPGWRQPPGVGSGPIGGSSVRPQSGPGGAPRSEPRRDDGSTGDGERSPWAPPHD